MEEWKKVKLGDCVEMQKGFAFKSSDYIKHGIKIIKVSNLNQKRFDDDSCVFISPILAEQYSRYSLVEDDIIISTVGSWPTNPESVVGKVCRVPKVINGSLLNQNAVRLRAKNNFNQKFLYYILLSSNFSSFIANTAQGSANQASITLEDIRSFKFISPSIKGQEKIVSILKSLDDKIEVNRRINEQLEELAQALFKSWFVDFEPFKDSEFVESELGMIPKGWKVYQLSDLVKIVGGYSYKGNELVDSDIAMATIKNFDRKGGFKIDGYKEIIPSAKLKESQVVTMHDIVVAHTDLTQNADIIGNPAMIMSLGGYKKLVISMDLVKVESTTENISNGFLYSLLKDARFKNHALGYVNGTTVLHLSKKALPDYKLALPVDLEILVEMSNAFDDIFLKEANNYSEIEHLTTLRDTLLPKLMSGEIDVNEINI